MEIKLHLLLFEKVVEIATATGEKLRFPTFETAKLGDITKMMMKSGEELEMLNNGSKAGRTVIKETAEKGLTTKAQSGMKRLKYELSKEILAKAKEQLVTLNVARTELIARLDDLLQKIPNLSQKAISDIKKAKNSIKDHLTQDDLVGAIRDVFGKEVKQSGSGYPYDHLGEVESAMQSLKQARNSITKDMQKLLQGSNEYKLLSKEADSLSELLRRIQTFLETK